MRIPLSILGHLGARDTKETVSKPMKSKTLIFIPTYDEQENVEKICSEILQLGLGVDILFLDDNSPDGTGQLLDALAETHPNVAIIHRPRRQGIGSAHFDGINWAYDNQYSTLITMDCDFTHRPKYLPDIIKSAEDCDVVVGSRFRHKKSLEEWNLFRKTLTIVGHLLTTTLLGMKYDATGAFRLYRLDAIPRELFGLVRSSSYSFFFESLYILQRNRFRINELPIALSARTYGHSKMRFRDVVGSFARLLNVRLGTLARSSTYRLPAPSNSRANSSSNNVDAGWDEYWMRPTTSTSRLYSRIASIYRKYVIKRNLSRLVLGNFPPRSKLLHAGCGGGEVDIDICGPNAVTAFDMSFPALATYKRIHGDGVGLVRGTVSELPLKDSSMDGIYNLGLLEHFTEDEIHQILTEFNRVLKSEGKMVVFWPPRFGLSVFVLRVAQFFLNTLMKRGVQFHPDEITLLKSRQHAAAMFEKAGFNVHKYYFGSKDLFTQSMIVVSKASVPSVPHGSAPRHADGDRPNGPQIIS